MLVLFELIQKELLWVTRIVLFFIEKKKEKDEEYAIPEETVFLFIAKRHSNERKSFDGHQFDATNICSRLLKAKQKLHCSRYPEEF